MSQTVECTFSLGSSGAGLTDLRVQPIGAGANIGAPITATFRDDLRGLYGFYSTAIPDAATRLLCYSVGTPTRRGSYDIPQSSGGDVGGPISFTLEFEDADEEPVPGVSFVVVGLVAGAADGAGEYTSGLPAIGSYQILAAPTLTVSFPLTTINVTTSGQTFTITGSSRTVPLPSDPGVTAGYLDCYSGSGVLTEGIQIRFRYVGAGDTGESFPKRSWYAASGENGRLVQEFYPSSNYEAQRDGGAWVAFTTPSSGTFALPPILGRQDA